MTGYTNIVQLGNKIINELKTLLENEGLVGQSKWDYILESFEEFKIALADPLICKELDNYKIERLNSVEKLGLSSNVITLYEEGLSPREIATDLRKKGISLSENDIKNFITDYNKSSITSRIEKSNTSVFDTEVQLQTIFDDLNEALSDLNNLSNEDTKRLSNARVVKEQLQIELHKERRQSVKQASELAQAIANLQHIKEFNKMVLEEVMKESPAAYQRLIKRINEGRSIFRGLTI